MINLIKRDILRLAPFFVTAIIYLVLVLPIWGIPQRTTLNATLKKLPILSLVYYILSRWYGLLQLCDKQSSLVFTGLLFSSVADFFLLLSEYLLYPGGFLFLCAHVCYTASTPNYFHNSRTKIFFVVGTIVTFLFFQASITSYIAKFVTFLYWSLLWFMAWRMTARYEVEKGGADLAGCIGGLFFVVSDFTLMRFPMADIFLMATYYIAQLGITLSTSVETVQSQ